MPLSLGKWPSNFGRAPIFRARPICIEEIVESVLNVSSRREPCSSTRTSSTAQSLKLSVWATRSSGKSGKRKLVRWYPIPPPPAVNQLAQKSQLRSAPAKTARRGRERRELLPLRGLFFRDVEIGQFWDRWFRSGTIGIPRFLALALPLHLGEHLSSLDLGALADFRGALDQAGCSSTHPCEMIFTVADPFLTPVLPGTVPRSIATVSCPASRGVPV
jgi:hypothetical protein